MAAADVFARIRKGPQMMTGNVVRQAGKTNISYDDDVQTASGKRQETIAVALISQPCLSSTPRNIWFTFNISQLKSNGPTNNQNGHYILARSRLSTMFASFNTLVEAVKIAMHGFVATRLNKKLKTDSDILRTDLGFNVSKRVTRQNSRINGLFQQKILEQDDLVTDVIDDLNDEHSAFLETIETDTDMDDDDYEQQPEPIVHDPSIALRPGCFKLHGGSKGKDRSDALPSRNSQGFPCGHLKSCNVARLHPPSALPIPLRLTTSSPLQDLQRWIITPPNPNPSALTSSRATDPFLSNARFTPADLRTAFVGLITDIKTTHTSLTALADYGSRYPYSLLWQPSLAPDAERAYLEIPSGETFAGFSREKLVEEVAAAAVEMDYLREVRESMATAVLRKKVKMAKVGNLGEAEKLVEQGWVDWDGVERECFFM